MFRSLRFRLPALFLAGIVLAVLVATVLALRLFQEYAREQTIQELQRQAAGLTALFQGQITLGPQPSAPRRLEQTTGGRIYYTGIDLFPGEIQFRPLREEDLG